MIITQQAKWLLTLILVGLTTLKSEGQFNHKQSDQDSAKLKKVKVAAVPMINYNRSYGVIFGLMASGYYRLNRADSISPSSSTMAVGMYSTSHTSMFAVIQNFYIDEDRWRLKFIGGMGDIFYQYFQGMPQLPPSLGQYFDESSGLWIDFENKMKFLVIDAQRRIFDGFYVGPLVNFTWATTAFDLPDYIPDEYTSKDADMFSLGYGISYDIRDNINYPTKGVFFDFKNKFNNESFGASNNFTQFELAANHFWDVHKDERSILVSRIYLNTAVGDVPFQGQSYMGRDDLRGYTKGEYRGNQVYAMQCEWRQIVHNRIGVVGFAGFGTVTDDFGDMGDAPFLPSIGVGFRYRMVESEKVNIGLDFGVGKNDWSLTFRIGEAFSR